MIEQIEWIKVEDRLPHEGALVLVNSGQGTTVEGFREGDLLYSLKTGWSISNAKYWAQMPTGPQS